MHHAGGQARPFLVGAPGLIAGHELRLLAAGPQRKREQRHQDERETRQDHGMKRYLRRS